MESEKKKKIKTTQRAYTLRLQGMDRRDSSWRTALWETHEAVNKGAKVFGDWLLTLRGGLDPSLVEAKLEDTNGKLDCDPTDEERKERRILLALSWLSVESRQGSPEKFIISDGKEISNKRNDNDKVIGAFKEILKTKGFEDNQIEEWIKDCEASLKAEIRNDAVWINRSKAYDTACDQIPSLHTGDAVKEFLIKTLFENEAKYLAPIDISKNKDTPESKELVQEARQWLSTCFGTGQKTDRESIEPIYRKIAQWADETSAITYTNGHDAIEGLVDYLQEFNPISRDLKGILTLIKTQGRPNKTQTLFKKIDDLNEFTKEDCLKLKNSAMSFVDDQSKKPGERPYANAILDDVEYACKITYRVDSDNKSVPVNDYAQYAADYKWGTARIDAINVMLDHAARRVSMNHSWIKRSEAERRKFDKNIKKKDNIPDSVKTWLDSYCKERSDVLGAVEPYHIRPKALGGWKKIVVKWNQNTCKTYDDRIEAAKILQADPTIDKFGDIGLFEALAEDKAQCVWRKDKDVSSEIDWLEDYVEVTEAEFKKRHFKVPAYRHPDMFRHPIFCDFGTSRWGIDFSILEAAHKMSKAKEKLFKKQTMLDEAEHVLEQCREQKKELKAKKKWEKATKERDQAKDEIDRLSELRGLTMTLWDGSSMKKNDLLWHSKKLTQDFALDQKSVINEDSSNEPSPITVTRADRLGRAAANVPLNNKVIIADLFEQKQWNGRLQAPRRQLEAIAAITDKLATKDTKEKYVSQIQNMKDRIRWFVTFSPNLQPQGPWCDFAAKHELSIDPKYYPHAAINKGRKGQARLMLSRLSGLRVLSVDLGHRYAAACAVWETLSTEQINEACKKFNHPAPKEEDLYLHLKKTVKKQRKGIEIDVEQTVVYRRIGSNVLPDRTTHPAPWARLDRQFFIKLQGEEADARKATAEEIKNVEEFEKQLGIQTPSKRSLGIDVLMQNTVNTMRKAINKHAIVAKIAYNLTATKKHLPGDQEQDLAEDKDVHVALLQDALIAWYGLFGDNPQPNDQLKQLWNDHIVTLSGYKAPESIDEASSSKERKKNQKEARDQLNAVAKSLEQNKPLRMKLHCQLTILWIQKDKCIQKHLRWLRDWILPRGAKKNDMTIRYRGGLSLNRIATIKSLYQIQKSFFMRPEPKDIRKNIPLKGQDDLRGFGQRILDTMEHLRDQRIKQLSSRITEAALGLGRMKSFTKIKDRKRPCERVDDPCQAIIIENLKNYRPEEIRTRRENRQIMTWSSAKVKKYLEEACQLNGLHFREISPRYTSQQDSRTGAAGIRCQDIPVTQFMDPSSWCQKQVKQAQKKLDKGKGTEEERFLCDLNTQWQNKNDDARKQARPIRIPSKGGDIFVSSSRQSSASKGIQADLNAAANIGLRAIIDPDWSGHWWYVPANLDGNGWRVVNKEIINGSTCLIDWKVAVDGSYYSNKGKPRKLGDDQSVKDAGERKNNAKSALDNAKKILKNSEKGKGNITKENAIKEVKITEEAMEISRTNLKNAKKAAKQKEIINLWRDVSEGSLRDGKWYEWSPYWNGVKARIITNILRRQAECLSSLDDG